MSRFTRQEEQPGRYNGISGFMDRMEKKSTTIPEDKIIYEIVGCLEITLALPPADIRTILNTPHKTRPDINIGTLVSTAINDLSSDDGAIHIAVMNNQEDPFIQAGIKRDDDHPDTMPHKVILILNSGSPEANPWKQINQVPTAASLISAIHAFASAGYVLLDELSKNSALVVRRNGK